MLTALGQKLCASCALASHQTRTTISRQDSKCSKPRRKPSSTCRFCSKICWSALGKMPRCCASVRNPAIGGIRRARTCLEGWEERSKSLWTNVGPVESGVGTKKEKQKPTRFSSKNEQLFPRIRIGQHQKHSQKEVFATWCSKPVSIKMSRGASSGGSLRPAVPAHFVARGEKQTKQAVLDMVDDGARNNQNK